MIAIYWDKENAFNHFLKSIQICNLTKREQRGQTSVEHKLWNVDIVVGKRVQSVLLGAYFVRVQIKRTTLKFVKSPFLTFIRQFYILICRKITDQTETNPISSSFAGLQQFPTELFSTINKSVFPRDPFTPGQFVFVYIVSGIKY